MTRARCSRRLLQLCNAPARFFLGKMFADGLAKPQSYTEAARLYRLAASQGFGLAQAELGRTLPRASGPPNYERAYVWLAVSEKQGNTGIAEIAKVSR